MKLKNVVAGMVIEAKHTVRGLSEEVIPKGLQVFVTDNDGRPTYGVRVTHEDIDDGYAWVNPEHFRKVKEVAEVKQGDAVPHNVQKGTEVVCVHGFVDPRFSDTFRVGLVYKLRRAGLDHDGELQLEHPSLGCGHGFGKPEHFRLYKEPQETVGIPIVEPEPVRPEVGDWVVANAVDLNLVAGIAYKVVGFSPVSDRAGIALHTHCEPAWQKVYYINTEDYSTVLREVKPDADTHT